MAKDKTATANGTTTATENRASGSIPESGSPPEPQMSPEAKLLASLKDAMKSGKTPRAAIQAALNRDLLIADGKQKVKLPLFERGATVTLTGAPLPKEGESCGETLLRSAMAEKAQYQRKTPNGRVDENGKPEGITDTANARVADVVLAEALASAVSDEVRLRLAAIVLKGGAR